MCVVHYFTSALGAKTTKVKSGVTSGIKSHSFHREEQPGQNKVLVELIKS